MRTLLFLAGTFAFFLIDAFAPAQDEKGAPPAQDELAKRALERQAEMTAIRGLKLKRDVKLGIYTKEELTEYVKREFARETPKEKIQRLQKAYQHFGLLPKDFDLYAASIELISSTTAGFYHSKSKEMRLIRSDPTGDLPNQLFQQQFGVSQDDVTIVHEMCHAAQDQHFELTTFPLKEETNDDLVSALRALIEGDAAIVGWKYAFKDQFDSLFSPMNERIKSGVLTDKAAELPTYMRKVLTFAYGYGGDFVLAVWRHAKEDWSAVSKLFSDPPSSTEQILHPRKYFAVRDYPTVITLEGVNAIVGTEWKELANNVHGEFVLRLLLDEFKMQKHRERVEAAAGWDGDRFVCFERGDRTLTIWYSTWDTEEDAREFAEAYTQLLQAKYECTAKDEGDQRLSFKTTLPNVGEVILERRGQDVLVVDGADPELLGRVKQLWACAVKTELKNVERLKLDYWCPKHATEESHKPGKCGVCGSELQKKEK